MVPRLRIAAWAISGTASATSGTCCRTSALVPSSAWVVRAPTRSRSPVSAMPASSPTRVMSISAGGSARRKASVASRLCPPASSFASAPASLHERNTSARDVARKYANDGAFMGMPRKAHKASAAMRRKPGSDRRNSADASRALRPLPSPEQAAEEAWLLLLGGGRHLRRRLAVGLAVLAVAGRHRGRVGADAAGAAVGLRLAGQREVEVDAGQALDRARRVVVLDLGDQVAGGAEHDVVFQVLVAREIERGHELAVAGRGNQEVDVGGAHAVPLLAHH